MGLIKNLVLIFWLCVVTLNAASPNFSSFNTNQFNTNGNRISLQDPLTVTNFYSSNIFVTNIVANTINVTNLYTTNLFVTNIYGDTVFHGKVTYNTNVTFVTNVVGSSPWVVNDLNSLAIQGAYRTNFYVGNLAAGTNDVFTIPAGKKYINTYALVGTTNASTIGGALKSGGAYYKFGTVNIVTNTTSSGSLFGALSLYVFEEGESVSIFSSAIGANFYLGGWLFGTNVPIRSVKILALTAGNNLLYEVPSSYAAHGSGAGTFGNGQSYIQGSYRNDSGVTRTVGSFVVPSGGSVDTTTRLANLTVNNNITTTFVYPMYMRAGDAAYVTSDASTATQWVFLTVMEFQE